MGGRPKNRVEVSSNYIEPGVVRKILINDQITKLAAL
jgi:hypothetical protein